MAAGQILKLRVKLNYYQLKNDGLIKRMNEINFLLTECIIRLLALAKKPLSILEDQQIHFNISLNIPNL